MKRYLVSFLSEPPVFPYEVKAENPEAARTKAAGYHKSVDLMKVYAEVFDIEAKHIFPFRGVTDAQ